MLATNAIDVSEHQWPGAMDWASLRAQGVELAIVKASQGLRGVDPHFAEHYANAHASGLPVACYHFLGPSDAGASEAEHFLRVVGERIHDPRTFLIVDWESNAITGEPAAPMTAVRHFLIAIDAAIGEGRVAWYSYRSLAALHRASLPWPLWLSDPSADGEAWAEYLGAFLLQTGQTTELLGHPFTLLTDSIINRETFAQLTGEQTVITKQDANLIAATIAEAFGLPVRRDEQSGEYQWPILVDMLTEGEGGKLEPKPFAYGAAPVWARDEALRGKLAAQTAATHSIRGADNAGTSATLVAQCVELLRANSVGLTPAQLAEALIEACKIVAPFLRVAVAAPATVRQQ